MSVAEARVEVTTSKKSVRSEPDGHVRGFESLARYPIMQGTYEDIRYESFLTHR